MFDRSHGTFHHFSQISLILGSLRFNQARTHKEIENMYGGWNKRVALPKE
jgi:ATPase subunit of ABC transporter with duplicated ATPase domains